MSTSDESGGEAGKKDEPWVGSGAVQHTRFLLCAVLLSSFLRFLAHPPVQFAHAAWVALVGYLFFFNRVESWKGLLVGTWVWAICFYLPCLAWIRHISLLAWFGLSVIMTLFPIVFAVTLRILKPERGVGQVVVGAGAWIMSEYVQTHFLSGFPYLFLSHSQAELTPLIQVSEVTGAWGISALLFLVNGLLYLILEEGIARWSRRDDMRETVYSVPMLAVTILLIVVGPLIYGYWRLGQLSLSAGPAIGVLQGNIPQTMKSGRASSDEIYEQHLRLASSVDHQTDLIVWPETMFPYPVMKKGERTEVYPPGKLRRLAEEVSADQLIGVRTLEQTSSGRRDYNSVWLLNREGRLTQHYAKYHLVPFGEYVPGQSLVPGLRTWLASMFPVSESVWLDAGPPPGKSQLIEWNGQRLAPMICYEVVFPGEFRSHVNKGADVAINISNEAWYRNEAELDQMLAIVRFRSVEHRITTVRATNTGISGFVFPDGRARLMRDKQGRVRGFRGTLVDRPKTHSGNTLYRRFGDWLILGALIGLTLQFLYRFGMKRTV